MPSISNEASEKGGGYCRATETYGGAACFYIETDGYDQHEDEGAKIHYSWPSSLRNLLTDSIKFHPKDIHKFEVQLKEIDETRKYGNFVDEQGNILQGSDGVTSLLERCQLYTGVILERLVAQQQLLGLVLIGFRRGGKFPDKWRPIYDILIGIRNDLDKLSLTQAWSLRETDLYDFQRQLDKIDESRVDGNWLDDDGQPAELYVQRVCTPFIHRNS